MEITQTHTGASTADAAASAVNTSTIADPTALGLAAFAGPGLVLGLVNAGALDSSALIATVLPFALFYGGLVELIAGIIAFRRGSTVIATAFCTYSAFWLSFAGYVRFFSAHASADATAVFILVFTINTAYIAVAALREGLVVFSVFALWPVSFLILTIESFQSSVPTQHVGGWIGVVAAGVAFYASGATLVNGTWRRPVLPMLAR
jgi:uncharacterized protein